MSSMTSQIFSDLADRLLAAWESGDTIPDPAVFLCDGLSAEQMLELCLLDQSYRWRLDKPLQVEDYLSLYPALAEQPELVFELLYGEVRTVQQLGHPLATLDISTRFPEHAARLQQQWTVGCWMEERLEPATPVVQNAAICRLHQSGRFGAYELGEAIAHGGMGVVFRARDVRLNRTVALKMIRPDRAGGKSDEHRFREETVTIAQLDHPHIVPVYDVGEVEGVQYFTMKLIEGGDLQQHRLRWLDEPHGAVRVMIDVADAVHHAHRCGILHRDMKPSNVLLDHAGRPYVTDFGLARRLDALVPLGESGDLLGTPAYLAPERLASEPMPLTVAADVYGLGAVLYVLLTGRPPLDVEHLGRLLENIRQREPVAPRQLNQRVDADLQQICLKALAKQPDDRYGSAQDFGEDLKRYLAGEPVAARPLSWWQRRRRWIRRHPDLALISGAMLLVAVSLLGLLGLQTLRLQAVHQSLDRSLGIARQREAEADAKRQEAADLRRAAEELQTAAAAARTEAFRQQQLARETAYASAMHHIEMAWKAGDTVEFSRLLDEQIPAENQRDIRGFEWFLLDRLHRPRSVRWPQLTAAVRCLAFSPDGRLLAAAGDSGQVQVIETNSGRVVASWLSLTTVRDVAFSRDGAQFATGSDDGTLRLYPADGGTPRVWPVAELPLWHVAFVGDAPQIATRDQDGIIRLVDHRDGQSVATWTNDPKVIDSMTVSPDGQWLVGGERDGYVSVWDVDTQQRVYHFRQDGSGSVKCLAFSPDGNLLATGSTDLRLHVFALSQPWTHRMIFVGQHFDHLQQVAIAPDGRRVAGCDKNGAVRIWRLDINAMVQEDETPGPEMSWQAHPTRGYTVAFDPQLPRLATGGHESHVALWPLDTGALELKLGETERIAQSDQWLTFSPDAARVITAASDGIQVWDRSRRTLDARLSRTGELREHVAISRDWDVPRRSMRTARRPRSLAEDGQGVPVAMGNYRPTWLSSMLFTGRPSTGHRQLARRQDRRLPDDDRGNRARRFRPGSVVASTSRPMGS
jgi:eukaryotic-like serine/threonine-protein kinase